MTGIYRQKPIYHVNTKNIHFLQVAKDLRTLGIKNNMFFLKLYDPALEKIDPYMPKLPRELVARIINECLRNPWYFLREVARIPVQGGTGIPFQLNRANLASTWCFINGIDHYTVIPRQIGKTQSAIAIILWAFLFGTTNSEFMFLNKSQTDANLNLDRLKKQRELLPEYLQFKYEFRDNGSIVEIKGNVQSLKHSNNGNKIVAFPKATSVEAAERIGRGATQPIQYYDEVEFTDHIKTIVETAGPAFNTASRNARENNAAYCRIFTSTPGDLDTQCGQEALQIVNNTCRFQEQFYDWEREKGIDFIKQYISNNSTNGIVYIEFNYKQLGKNEEWLKEMSRVLNNNPMKIKREVFLKRMRGSSESPYAPEDLDEIDQKRGTVIKELFINGLFKVNLYEELKRDRHYLVGVDVSDGYGGDNNAMIIFDPYTLTVVGDFKCPYASTTMLARFLETLVKKHIPNAILCIERNRGAGLIATLHESPIKNRLYYENNKNLIKIDERLDPRGFLKADAAMRKLYGVWTGTESRSEMFRLLEEHILNHKDKFKSNYLIDEILGLIRKNGKIQAGSGFTDDVVLAYLMCLYVYYHGNNLRKFGFVPGLAPPEEERNKGLTYNDILNNFDEETREYFESTGGQYDMNDYDKFVAAEIERARKEASRLNRLINPINGVERIDEDFEVGGNNSINLDLFDELNDF